LDLGGFGGLGKFTGSKSPRKTKLFSLGIEKSTQKKLEILIFKVKSLVLRGLLLPVNLGKT